MVDSVALYSYPCRSNCWRVYDQCIDEGIPASILDNALYCNETYADIGARFLPSNHTTPCVSDAQQNTPPAPCYEGFSACGDTCCPSCPVRLASSAQEDFLQNWITACSWISFFCALACTITWLIFPAKRSFPSVFVLYLSVSALGVSIGFLISQSGSTVVHCADAFTPADRSNPGCFFQAVFFQYFFLAAACWWVCFAFSVNQYVVFNRQLQGYSKYDHAFSWGLPGVLTLAAIASDSIAYSQNARICFLKENTGVQVGLFFLWLGLIGLVGTALMCQLLWYIFAMKKKMAGQRSGGKHGVSPKTIIFFVGYNIIIVYTFFFNLSTLGLQDKINQVTQDYLDCGVARADTGVYLFFWPNGTLIGPDPTIYIPELAAAGLSVRDLPTRYEYASSCNKASPISFPAIVINTTLVTLIGLWVFLLFGLTQENAQLWHHMIAKRIFSDYSVTQQPTKTASKAPTELQRRGTLTSTAKETTTSSAAHSPRESGG
eukprot:TRINITY_DN7038_c0_g1_i1.p1 TRINITY_DN7038_c0_g1~~TRINITY_DN7038_c0_g1_i1.p1  ORF type:complete len:490 (-),score=87.20 TRINITY_DN7038_c0_g1_i1:55-1524(-)